MTTIGSICSKCGTIKKSGKLSCCAPDGAWSGQCGDEGESKHTWREGMFACKKKLAVKAPAATIVNNHSAALISGLVSSIADDASTAAKVNTKVGFGFPCMPTLIVHLLVVLIVWMDN